MMPLSKLSQLALILSLLMNVINGDSNGGLMIDAMSQFNRLVFRPLIGFILIFFLLATSHYSKKYKLEFFANEKIQHYTKICQMTAIECKSIEKKKQK